MARKTGNKGTEMVELSLVARNARVLGSDGVLVGTVDHVEGDRIGLRNSTTSDGAEPEQQFIAHRMAGFD